MFQLQIIGGMIGKGEQRNVKRQLYRERKPTDGRMGAAEQLLPFSGMKPYRLGNPIRSRAPFCVFSSAG